MRGVLRGLMVMVCVLPFVATGCGAFVQSTYGWPNKDKVRVEDTVVETIQKLGAPDFQSISKDEKLLAWKHVERMSVLGLFEQVKKGELVVLARDDQVTSVDYVDRGQAMAVLGLTAWHTDEEE